MLRAESLVTATLGERCKVLAGQWRSAYDGVVATSPDAVQIDHLVPLAEAWRSGAATWTPERRADFANDIVNPNTLAAVSGRSNESKGDKGPDQWLPADPADRCTYGEAWVDVKAKWGLTVDPNERRALAAVLAAC